MDCWVGVDVGARKLVYSCPRVALLILHAKSRHIAIWFHHISRHDLINGTIFGKMLLSIKYVFLFMLHILFETFHILRRI